uniref:PDEase domain-containing protein n=1 Tax=Schistocephalus solidus TaxID=70667 RepID=A0A183T898_SCHSO
LHKLESLLLRLEIGYTKYKNPYHNLVHAADVAQTFECAQPVVTTNAKNPEMVFLPLQDYLTDLDVFAVVYAALIHDFEHTGTTNNFHVQTQYTDLKFPGMDGAVRVKSQLGSRLLFFPSAIEF